MSRWSAAAAGLGWVVAAAWVWKTAEFLLHIREVPDLREPRYGHPLPEDAPRLAVIVPARNEEAAVEATVRSLLAQEGVPLEVVAVDDRSTDRTGAILDQVADERLRVVHVRELPAGWMGKQNALAQGVAATAAPYLLFTDGDIFFRRHALLRAMRYMLDEGADHLVLLPTPLAKSPGERMMLSAMQVLSAFAIRLWKIADPRSRDHLGVGAFNLVRREAYEAIGGFAALRMEVLEDLRLGVEIKRRGLRQRAALGPGLVTLHWASGVGGIIRNVTKNFFAAFRFSLPLTLLGAGSVFALGIWPALGLLGSPGRRAASLVTLGAQLVLFRQCRRDGSAGARYALLLPAAASLLVYAMLRSAAVTLAQGAVVWRGTAYPLRELRAQAGPLL